MDMSTGLITSRSPQQGTIQRTVAPIREAVKQQIRQRQLRTSADKARKQRVANGQSVMVKGKEVPVNPQKAQLNQENKTNWQREQSHQASEHAYHDQKMQQAEQQTATALGEFASRLMPSTIVRAAYDQATGDKSFAGSMVEGNRGLGNPIANFAFDIATPVGIAKATNLAGKAFKYPWNVPNWARKFVFKSELDWSPESWFSTRPKGVGYDAEDVATLKKHIPEYHEIERKAKANGTWLKMPDGSTWTGDPRSWVQLQSKAGQKLAQDRNFGAVSYLKPNNMKTYPIYEGDSWLQNTKEFAQKWSGQDHPITAKRGAGYFEITYPKDAKILEFDAKGQYHYQIPHPDVRRTLPTTTDQAVWWSKDHNYDITKINNVIEGLGTKVNDVIIHENVPRKSLLGNNGDFDFLNKNIYKMLIPTVIGTYSSQK